MPFVSNTGLAHYHEKVKELLNNKTDYIATRLFQEDTGKVVYVKLFTLTITGSYADINYEFAVTRRGNGPSYVNLFVQSMNDKYANDISLTYRGLNGDVESNLKAYHYKDTTKAVSTIQVWYKVNAWDDIRFFNRTFVPRSGTITWESTFTAGTAFPADATATINCAKATFLANVAWDSITGKPTITSKNVRTLSAEGPSGWEGVSTDDNYVPTMSLIGYWNGAYSGTSSNLAYCKQGAFGTIVTKDAGDYAAASHSHNYITTKDSNTITSIENDTTTNWGEQNTSVHFYSDENQLIDQPSQYGLMFNAAFGTEVHQLWMAQASNDMAHRGGNRNGWFGSWKTILDSDNFTNYAASKSHDHTCITNDEIDALFK
nr:MAG TPA: hypothetical protein [Caudoviricetes sp.]